MKNIIQIYSPANIYICAHLSFKDFKYLIQILASGINR